jgi:hypothetical protein
VSARNVVGEGISVVITDRVVVCFYFAVVGANA